MSDILAKSSPRNFGFSSWLQPRSTDRDEAFRERIIRISLAVMITISLLALSTSIFVYQNSWDIISYPSISAYSILLYLGSAYALLNHRVALAGLFLNFGILVLIVLSIWLGLRVSNSLDPIAVSTFILVPLISALVLPRAYIILFTIMTALAFAPLAFLALSSDIATSQIISMSLVLIMAGALLYRFRTEFDARLQAMTTSLDQERIAKAEAESAQERAEIADRAKSQFLANMSHELRTPLNAIIGYDEAMLGGMVGTFTPKQEQLLGHIQYNGRRLLGLINDILDLAKIESGSLKIYIAPMSPKQVVIQTVESVRSLAQDKALSLEVKVEEDVPELVLSDEKKIEQIIINLVGNAIKFTNKGGVYVDVCSLDSRSWQIKVRDTGIGIPEDKLKTIFDPFHQVDNSSTRKYKGTGLGLSISKGLVDMLNGQMEVSSEIEKGTCFVLTLPRILSEEAPLELQVKQAKSQPLIH